LLLIVIVITTRQLELCLLAVTEEGSNVMWH